MEENSESSIEEFKAKAGGGARRAHRVARSNGTEQTK